MSPSYCAVKEIFEQVSLIQASEFDAQSLSDISKLAFNNILEMGAPSKEWPPGYDDHKWQIRAIKTKSYYCILLHDSIVGGVIIELGGEEHNILERIFVNPEHHNKEVGAKAMELTIKQYPMVKVWTLGVPEWNERASCFFKKLGFTQIGWDNTDLKFRSRWYQKIMDSTYRPLKVEELKEGMGNVTIEGGILEKSLARLVRSRRSYGKILSVANASLGDDTGRLALTLWNNQIKIVSVGDQIRIENGYVGSYRGINQISTGKAGRIIHII